MYHLHFAYFTVFYFLVPLWAIITFYRIKFYKAPIYKFPLAIEIKKTAFAKTNLHKKVFFVLRSLILLFMIFLIARPQWADSRSRINVDGVDIIITLDVSGSMQLFDDINDRRSRISVAKEEAIRFIKKRPDDPIGIVIFGADAVSQCPLTLDKKVLVDIVQSIQLGVINTAGTALGTGIATSVNKLKNSKTKSKIIILLTDGQPTPQTDLIPVDTSIELAKQFGIKIYTIGIGNKNGAFVNSAFGFVERVPDSVDDVLLNKIAQQTGGHAFRANNPQEMKAIYDTIDKLEKTQYSTNLFSKFYEAFAPFALILLLLIAIELALSLFIWRGIL